MRDYNFGDFIHELRIRRGLSQYQLGKLLGVSDRAVSKWENGLAKPKSGVLCALSDTLGVRVDELLSGRTNAVSDTDNTEITARWRRIREATDHSFHRLYGNTPSPLIRNRYLSEWQEYRHTDTVLTLELIGQLMTTAKQKNEYIRLNGVLGSSFIAYLLGAVDIHPLAPHYYCPHCQAITFSSDALCGWDLPPERCSCGRWLERDGHSLPYEVIRRTEGDPCKADIILSYGFYESARRCIREYHAPGKLVSLKREESDTETLVLLPADMPGITDGQSLPFDPYFATFRSYPRINLRRRHELDSLKALSDATGVPPHHADIRHESVLEAFLTGDTQGIPEFELPILKRMIAKKQPRTRHDLIQLLGVAHSLGRPMDADIPLDRCIAYREDVFTYVQTRLNRYGSPHTGLAYQIMEEASRGVYARNALPAETRQLLLSIEAEDTFLHTLEQLRYLPPAYHGVECIRYAMTLMWYKLHYPAEFRKYIHPIP